ncbi:MAG: HAD-IA family hydrolase [Nitrospinae bacterium]|nr:HAD-IA family hydrolase [Nitrospinota bacterium]
MPPTLDVDIAVFDLDGTLIDSKTDIANALNWTFGRFGYDPLPMELIGEFVGNGVGPLITRAAQAAGHAEREPEILELFRGRYWDHLLDHTVMFPGVAETLAYLNGRYRMGLVSNKPERYTQRIVDELGMRPYFGRAVFGGDTLPVKKPDPAALREIARLYGGATARMVYVGDSAVDVRTARNAGALPIAVTYGFRGIEELRGAGPEMMIGRFDELRELL